MKILLTENIHPVAKQRLEEQGFDVTLIDYSPPPEELKDMIKEYQAIGIRSKTKMTKEMIDAAENLLVIGCFCIGTNQVDLEYARKKGIVVFNAPHSNTRSVAELVLAEMVALARKLGDINTAAHKGDWMKTAVGNNEIRGKTLGIIGYGHIGSQVSVLAEAFGLNVIFYDITKKLPLGNAVARDTMDELLAESDFVTLHVPETPETKYMFTKVEMSKMKKGAYLLNLSRGTVIEIDDLVEALKSKHIGGAAIDVFPKEPRTPTDRFESPLQNLPNVILTPHIGGSTEEAQFSIGNEVSDSLTGFLKAGSTAGAYNFPNVDINLKKGTHRVINVHKNEPGVLGEINSIISTQGANIDSQYLATDEEIGYLVMDVEASQVEPLANEIKELPRSIKTRVVS